MNILFLTIIPKIKQRMTLELAKELVQRGNRVFIACPADEQNKASNTFVPIDGMDYLFVAAGYSVGKVNIVKKAMRFLSLDAVFGRIVSKALYGQNIDLILYSTPPITLANTIAKIKKQQQAKTYLMLKDIFPQNAVDMGMMKKTGLMGIAYQYFRNKEKLFYRISDYIGCMSPKNIEYVKTHNPEILPEKLGLCVNAYKLEPVLEIDKATIRRRYKIPLDRTVFLYGGNLGKPQGLDYFVRVLEENKTREDCFFLICGSGNEENKIIDYIQSSGAQNVQYMKSIPAEDFDALTKACDVGMVFLDHRFTIPNYPSRMLSIMLNEKPILAATDKNTDVNQLIADGDLGWWCESTDTTPMNAFIEEICSHPEEVARKGKNARKYFESHFTSEIACDQVLSALQNGCKT